MSQFQAVKMTYALNNEENFVSVEDVENGLGCECVCIDCHGRLSAKQGKVKQWHFAHHQESDKENCQWSGESEIHLRVKKYLDTHRKLTVPLGFSNPTMFTLNFDEIQLEKSLRPTKRIPDVTGYCRGERILIEVKVTHEVDRKKVSEYKAANASVVEIDFSEFTLLEDRISDKHIERHLCRTSFNWISVAPVGVIAEQFQNHERAVSKTLIEKNKKLRIQHSLLEDEINQKCDYINSFSYRYEDNQNRMKTLTDELSYVSVQIQELRNEKLRHIDAARSSFTNTMKAMEEEYLRQLDAQNTSKLELIEEKFTRKLKVKYKDLIAEQADAESLLASTSSLLSTSKTELEVVNKKVEEINELEINLLKREALLKKKEQEWLRAANASASIRKHFLRLEPDLRLICRKGGVPWPFNGNLLDELSLEV
ncbi:competence protein CoiA family protein [Shewanella kaireitica]|uniref:competence protein CoiA family protein n=1 Tax=Shewanella kaireitica TaxID=212021 RepID=UPI00200E9FCE|nr:competence protein CoiA family protein [Shewanella kaireitica]MCL1096164.1 hypothetical protein [Shewanella kaireitica]